MQHDAAGTTSQVTGLTATVEHRITTTTANRNLLTNNDIAQRTLAKPLLMIQQQFRQFCTIFGGQTQQGDDQGFKGQIWTVFRLVGASYGASGVFTFRKLFYIRT